MPSSLLPIPSAHTICASRLLVSRDYRHYDCSGYRWVYAYDYRYYRCVCVLLINNTNDVIVVRVVNLITTNIILIIFAEVT